MNPLNWNNLILFCVFKNAKEIHPCPIAMIER